MRILTLRQAAQKASHHAGIQHVRKTWDGYSQRLQFSPPPVEGTQLLAGLGEPVRSRRKGTALLLSCSGIKRLPRSVSDSSLVNEVWNFLMMVVNAVGFTGNCEYPPLLIFWPFELVVHNLSASAHVQWPAVVPEFTVNMEIMKDRVKHFQDKHFPFLSFAIWETETEMQSLKIFLLYPNVSKGLVILDLDLETIWRRLIFGGWECCTSWLIRLFWHILNWALK